MVIGLIQQLLDSFEESDIEVLIFILHNIGLQLRKADPISIRDIIATAEQKKNSIAAEIKMTTDEETKDRLKKKERKANFLNMEL